MNLALKHIQDQIDDYKAKNPNESVGELSDTYHSFNDLYKHRTILTAFAFSRTPFAWKSKVHEDGNMFDGMFIVGCATPDGMITYHYDLEYWNLFKIPELPHAPHFDGHTSEDVLNRLEKYIGANLSPEEKSKINKVVVEEILPVFGDDIVGASSFITYYAGKTSY